MQLYLSDSEKNGVTVKIHRAYQKKITNEMKRTVNTVPTTSEKKLRVTQSEKTELAGKLVASIADLRVFQTLNNLTVKKIGNVCTMPFKESVLKTCDQRNDKWA